MPGMAKITLTLPHTEGMNGCLPVQRKKKAKNGIDFKPPGSPGAKEEMFVEKVETYCDKLLSAMISGREPMAHAVMDKATERISKDIQELFGKYDSVDYPMVIASMNVALKGITGTLTGSGVTLVKYFEERMQAAVFTTPREEK